MKTLYVLFATLLFLGFTSVSAQWLKVTPTVHNVGPQESQVTFKVSGTVFSWGVSDNVSWLKTSVKDKIITASYTANTSPAPRIATLTIKDGVSKDVRATVVQVGTTLTVTPTSLSVDDGINSKTIKVNSNVGWSVSDNASWINATKTSGTQVSVSISRNTSTSSRTGKIYVKGNGVTRTVDVKQAGADPYIVVKPEVLPVGSRAGTESVPVSSNVTWTVNDDAKWLQATKLGAAKLGLTWEINKSTSQRTAIVTLSGGGAGDKLQVIQKGAEPYLDVSPNVKDVGPEAGTKSFSVDANVEWKVGAVASWVTVAQRGSDIAVSYRKNTSTDAREAKISVRGTHDLSEIVTLKQAGADPYLDVSPDSESVSSKAGSISFSVDANVTWTVSDDASWLKASKNGSNIDVSYDKNSGTDPRTANITASGEGQSETVTVTQSGASAYINISPDSESVNAKSGTTSFSVSANVEWSVSDDASWLTASKTDGKTIGVSYKTNSSTSSRTANITASGGGKSKTVTVTQAGASAYLDVSPDSENAGPESGTVNFSVSANVDWTVSDDASWLTATKTDETTLSVSYEANSSTSSRTANITASGGGLSETVTLTQAGASAYLDVSPDSESVSVESGTVNFSVSANVEWTVSDDASWLTASKTDETTLSVSYEANSSTSSRTANITASGGGLSETVTVTQEGEAIAYYIDLSSNSVTVGCVCGAASITVSSNVDWSVSSDESWLVPTKTDASTLTLDFEDNTGGIERSATITVSGENISRFVTVTQEKADATAVDNYPGDQMFTIYPNPVKDVLHIKTASEIGEDMNIVLYDIRGKLIHSQTVSQPTKGEIISIDVSLFESGIYFIRLDNSKTYKIHKF